MLLGFHPSDDSATRASRQQESTGWSAWLALVRQNWRFLACVCLLQGHMRPITVLVPFTGRQLATRPRRWVFVVAGRGGGSHYLCAE